MIELIKKSIDSYWIVIGVGIIIIYFSPYIVLLENSLIGIWETLDSSVAAMKMVVDTGWYPDRKIVMDNVMNGLSINLFPSKINFIFFIHYILPPFFAYIINEFIVRIIAFIGIFLLMDKYVISNQNRFLTFTLSIIFSIIPFMPMYGLSVPGQPLLFYAFLNLLNNESKWHNYFVIILFGLYSNLFLAGFFIIIVSIAMLSIKIYYTKKIPLYYVSGIAILCITYFVAEFQLITFIFSDGYFVSHRNAVLVSNPSFENLLKEFLFSSQIIFKTQGHMGPIYTLVIICSILFSLFIISAKKTDSIDCKTSWNLEIGMPKSIPKKMKYVMLLISIIILYCIIDPVITLLLHDKFMILKTFQFNRFYCLLTPLWIIMFGLSLEVLLNKKMILLLISLIILQVLTIVFDRRSVNINYAQNVVYMATSFKVKNSISFRQFFDVDLFSKIDNFINLPKENYRVISLGLYPSVAQFNGFYTLDSYQTTYPLEYKNKFRKIMEKELIKSKKWRHYFDSWGSRCYLFSSEIERFAVGKHQTVEINNLEINTDAIKKMGGKYIFSAVRINNSREINLVLEEIFETNTSWWRVYLYKVI
jgi:hypothetical protein